MILETEHLILRPFRQDDLNAIHPLFTDTDIMHMLAMDPPSLTLEDSKEILDEWISDEDRYAIVLKKNKALIGYIVIHPDSEFDREDTKELGFALLKEYRKQGYMSETLNYILEYLASQHIKYVWACCLHENIESKRLIEKLNFEYIQDGEVEIEEDCFYPTYEYRITLKHKTNHNLLVRIKEICYNIAGKKG